MWEIAAQSQRPEKGTGAISEQEIAPVPFSGLGVTKLIQNRSKLAETLLKQFSIR
jgi:hypothetical protein